MRFRLFLFANRVDRAAAVTNWSVGRSHPGEARDKQSAQERLRHWRTVSALGLAGAPAQESEQARALAPGPDKLTELEKPVPTACWV